jgi:hypothetical protein
MVAGRAGVRGRRIVRFFLHGWQIQVLIRSLEWFSAASR